MDKRSLNLGVFLTISLVTVSGFEFRKRELPPKGEVIIFANENYKGSSETYELPKYVCVNIDPAFIGHTSSLQPSPDTCVKVFRNLGCPDSEKPTVLREHDFGTDSLVRIGLNDKVSSLKLC